MTSFETMYLSRIVVHLRDLRNVVSFALQYRWQIEVFPREYSSPEIKKKDFRLLEEENSLWSGH